MKEKREFLRSDLSIEVNWKKFSDVLGKVVYHVSKTKNISAEGICLILDKMLNVGDMLELEIKFSEERSIYSKGRVTWINEFETSEESTRYEGGVEFLNLSDEFKQWLNKYIANFLDFERV